MYRRGETFLQTLAVLYILLFTGLQKQVNAIEDDRSARIIRHTLPNGLHQVNGSRPKGGCPSSGDAVCLTNHHASYLNDGVFPEAVDTSNSDWADGFFTVNRRDSTIIKIGFELEENATVREVQISLLNFHGWGIGAQRVTLYGTTDDFLAFNVDDATRLGDTDVTVGNNSNRMSVVKARIRFYLSSFYSYFLVFKYSTNSNLRWLFIAEVRFFENSSSSAEAVTSPIVPLPTTYVNNNPSLTTSTRTPVSTVLQPTLMTTPTANSRTNNNGFPLLTALVACVFGLLLICAVGVFLCICVCCAVRKRIISKERTLSSVSDVYDDLVNFHRHSGEEVVNHEHESAMGQSSTSPVYTAVIETSTSVPYCKIPLKPNKAYSCANAGVKTHQTQGQKI